MAVPVRLHASHPRQATPSAPPPRFNFGGTINWFPGHMAKASRTIESSLKKIDTIIEVRDARIPLSSQNPILTNMINERKKHIVVFAKSDLSSPTVNKDLLQVMKERHGVKYALLTDLTHKWRVQNRQDLWKLVRQADSEILQLNSTPPQPAKATAEAPKSEAKPSLYNLPTSLPLAEPKAPSKSGEMSISMVIGLPNVGKSSLINQLVGKTQAGVAAKPGWTRGQHLYRINTAGSIVSSDSLQPPPSPSNPKFRPKGPTTPVVRDPLSTPFLDSLGKQNTWIVDNPGVMIPSRLDTETGLRLALCGCIDDTVVPEGVKTIGDFLYFLLTEGLPVLDPSQEPWWRRLQMENPPQTYQQTLSHIGKRWGRPREQEQAQWFVAMFRKGQLGRYTLDSMDSAT